MTEEIKQPKEVAPDGQIMLDENGLPPLRTKRENVNWDYVISLDTNMGSPLPDWNKRNEEEL